MGFPVEVLVAGQHLLARAGDLADFDRLMERRQKRPRDQWWLPLRDLARLLGNPQATGRSAS